MKNVWIINHYAKTNSGRHYSFAKELTDRGYSVKVVCANTSLTNPVIYTPINKVKEKVFNNVQFNIIPAKNYYGNGKDRVINILQFSLRAYKHLRKSKEIPDIIYASSVHPLNWVVGYFLSKKFKSKLVIETRDLWPETLIRMGAIKEKSPISKTLYSLEKFIYKKADHLVFTMPGGRKYLNNRKIKNEKISNINNGVDIDEFNYNAYNYPYKFIENPDSFNIVYTGSMGRANALDIILETAIKMKEQSDIYFHLFGDGYQRESLELFAQKKQLNNVIFYGKVNKKYIPSILKQADANIATSLNLPIYEYGISLNKLFDYFAAGKPIISNIPTPYNKIEQYGAGITVKPESIEALVDAINKIKTLENVHYKAMCNNSKQAAMLFDYEKLVDQLEETFI